MNPFDLLTAKIGNNLFTFMYVRNLFEKYLASPHKAGLTSIIILILKNRYFYIFLIY